VYILLVILAFSVLVISHELGHFALAKLNDVKVEEFSLGMGPKIFGIKGKETEYMVKALPIGGYVKMLGEGEEEKSNDPRAFSNKSPLRKLSIIAAGPLMNLALAIIIFAVIGASKGVILPEVAGLRSGSPAENHLKIGDKIIEINGQKIITWNEVSSEIFTNGKNEVSIKVERGMETKAYKLMPILNPETDSYIIGVAPKAVEAPSIGLSISQGFKETYSFMRQTVEAFRDLFVKKDAVDNIGGPLTIGRVTVAAAKRGIWDLLFLVALISVQLAIFNIIPFPALDGGWILLFLFEIITRKKIDEKKVAVVNYVGITILMLIMLLVFLKDIFDPIQL
jgi:RIP metalloprotease RseP